MYNITDHEVCAESVLLNHGGVKEKDLTKIISNDLNADDAGNDDEIDTMSHSPYFLPSHLPNHLINSFGILSLNAGSLLAKFNSLQILLELLSSQNIHFPVICIQESWITDESMLQLLQLNGYNTFHVNASSSTHGGVVTYVDNSYDVTIKAQVNNSDIWDGLFLEIKHENMKNKIIVGNIYKPPKDNNNCGNVNGFISELEPILHDLSNTNSEVLICGDYNINLLKINSEQHFSYFFDTMLSYSFFPKITFPTRLNNSSGATLIDNIFCKLSALTLQTKAGIMLDEISDHFPYFISLNVCLNTTKPPRLVKKRINSDKAIKNMVTDMNACDISKTMNNDLSSDPNLNYNILHDHITEMKKKHLPYKFEKFHKHKHKNNKWISFGIIRSIKTRDEMYLKFKRCNQQNVEYDTLKNNLHVFNRILKKAIREAKIQYYDKLFEQHRSDIKKTWQTISDIICKSNTKRKTLDKIIVDSKVIKDKGEICDKFNDFFANIGPKLATQIKPISDKTYDTFLKKRLLMSFAFTLVAENDVLKHLSSLRTKNSAGIDGISVKLLKKISSALISPLTLIINQSLVTGIFPDKLKIAKVLPLFKKDDHTLMDNYRPISLLTSISKLYEKVVFSQLYDYFRNNDLFYDSQYGFLKNHSTEYAAMELTDKVLKDIDERNISLAIFMDLSKAFDTLDHSILINKLAYYGIHGAALRWFTSYLTGRSQYVEIDGVSSNILLLSTGVPQGSILGPLLFLIYMNDIPNCTEHFNFILYADDTTLNNTVQIPSLSPVDINNELAKVYDWLAVNKLSLNVRKTKYVIFHAMNKRIEGVIPSLEINGIPLERVQNFNFLGLVLNENMSWKPHIDLLANKLAKCAGVLNKLKRFLPIHILRTLYFSMVQSRLVYCILTWGFDCYRLEKLQKRFARIISSSKYNAHSEPLFKVLDILKIEHLFSQNCLKFVYKFKNSQLPKYFLSLQCVPRSSIHDHDTRNASQIDTVYTRTHMAAKCIRSQLPLVLNDTPEVILNKINTHSIQGFSFFVKQYYLSKYTTQCHEIACYVCNNWFYCFFQCAIIII